LRGSSVSTVKAEAQGQIYFGMEIIINEMQNNTIQIAKKHFVLTNPSIWRGKLIWSHVINTGCYD